MLTIGAAAVLLAACTGRGGNSSAAKQQETSGGAGGSGSSSPCDPLTPVAVTLGSILGVGQDTQSTVYLADQAPDGGGQDRVFVSTGETLYRKHVAGTGETGDPPNADYTFSFQDPFADASDARALLIQVRAGGVTAMALGPGDSRSFYAPDAGDESLTVVDASAIAGFSLQNLPVEVEYVADVSNGEAIVVTEPMDPWGYSGFRLFYGTPSQMIERPIVAYNRGDRDDYVSFAVDGAMYTADFTFAAFGSGGGGNTAPGPESLETDDAAMLPMTDRVPTPTTLSGFSFVCLD